ncbi:MAG: phosphate acyltransferase, partial [Pseudomonadota bacterium]
HNGAVFLGLNGVIVKSHGSANAKGVSHAVNVAASLLENELTQRIAQDLERLGDEWGARGSEAASDGKPSDKEPTA